MRAAIKVLVNRGYSQFTTAEVASVAGTSRGALTHHFKSTQVFILAALDYLYAALLRKTERRVLKAKTSDDLIDPILEDASDFLLGAEFISIYNALVEMRNQGADIDITDIGIRYRKPIEDLWIDFLASRGVEESVAKDVVWATFSIIRGLAIRRILYDDPAQTKRTMDFATQLMRQQVEASRATAERLG